MVRIVLVPTDLSSASEEAIAFAAELGRKQGARLILLHAVEDNRAGPRDERERDLARRESHAHHRLDLIRKGLPPGSDIEVVRGHPGPAIVDYAAHHNVRLIVMATHGRTGLARLLLGSVTEYVVRRAPCPVACIRPSKEGATQPVTVGAPASPKAIVRR